MIITGASKNSQQNKSKTVADENDKEIFKERYISPDERRKIIDNLGIYKKKTCKTMHQISQLNLWQKIGFKINDNARGIITPIVKLNLKFHI